MGLEEDNGPPKKKLKQAQLSFSNVQKRQKRKLSSDLSDEVQLNKIVCKETEKENVEINNTPECVLSDKLPKSDLDSVKKNVSEKILINETVNTEVLDAVVPKTLKQDLQPIANNTLEGQKTPEDFTLSISDSVFNTLNAENVLGESEKNPTNGNLSVGKICSSINGTNGSCSVTSKELECSVEEDLPTTDQSLAEEDLDKTLNSEDDDDWISSEGSPKNKSPITPKDKITPKRLESLKKREEKERRLLERKALRDKVKEERIKVRQEKKDKKRKEREEKEKKRQAELKVKEEEKKQKEEEKKKREEEKKQKEEERRVKEEEKRRKEEAKEEEKRKKEEINEKKKAAFANFFIAKRKLSDTNEKVKETEKIVFMPFPMKPDMRLANEPRRRITDEEKKVLDSVVSGETEKPKGLYLTELKSGSHSPQKTEATWHDISQEEEHDVIIVESTANGECVDLTNSKELDNRKKMKAKLLQFHDNRRPPYFGTWRKRSKSLGPRNPHGQDKEMFDYDVDSDSEWEDEGEGEDVDKEGDGDGDSDEDQGEEEENSGENGYLLDNTFVPHGYLSDEEVHPDDDIDDNDPENLKLRMKLLKQEFDEEMRSKTERLKPRLLGCVWISNGTTEVSAGSLYETLMRFRAVWNEDAGPIDLSGPEIEDSPTSTVQSKSKPFPQTVLPVLAKFVHESSLPLSALVREFLVLIEKDYPSENIKKRTTTLKIKEIATKIFVEAVGKSVWSVNLAMCKEYGLKPINNSNSSILSAQVIEKPKESLLVNFLKGVSTPQPVKKRVQLIPVNDSTPIRNENEKIPHIATPRPIDTVFKKRAQLITLPRTPDNTISSLVHKDTPRPLHVAPRVETIDLSLDSP